MSTNPNQTRSIRKDEVVFPDEIEGILKTNRDEVKKLCKRLNILPKRDNISGKTFFLKNDVEALMRLKELHDRGDKIANRKKIDNPQRSDLKSNLPIKARNSLESEFKVVMNKFIQTQEGMVDKLSRVIDDKLDGMDEVVVELIRCKTENENLRHKLNDLTKENYNLRNELDSFKSLGFGFYIKRPDEDN